MLLLNHKINIGGKNMDEITINNDNGILTVSSLQVAEDFEKQHKHILNAIENIKAENSAVTSMFIKSTYQSGTGKNYKCYNLTRDGFSLLVMGFTGKKALGWKLKYIEAFNKMEEAIKNMQIALDNRTKAIMNIMNANNDIEKVSALKEFENIITTPLLETIEEQKPKVEIADNRINKKGCFTITDVTRSLKLKVGQITNWAKDKGYIHKSRQEVNNAGLEYFKVYSEDGVHNCIGITDEGLSHINEHIMEIKQSPCRVKKAV